MQTPTRSKSERRLADDGEAEMSGISDSACKIGSQGLTKDILVNELGFEGQTGNFLAPAREIGV